MWLYDNPIAHRGLHNNKFSENSMSAFINAVSHGFNIEIDVHILKDGTVAIFHDFSLMRMTGKEGFIEDLTLSDITGEEYLLPNGEHIPLLKDLLKIVDGKVGLLIELKSKSSFNYTLESSVYNLIKPHLLWTVVQSFNPLSIIWYKNNAPEVTRGQLASYPPNKLMNIVFFLFGPIAMLRYSKPNFLSYDIEFLPAERIVKRLKKYNLNLLVWTINTLDKVKTAKNVDADNIIFELIDIDSKNFKNI